jgi:nucleoprotein TPR
LKNSNYDPERHRMSQEQMAMHAQEINDLTKRNEQLILQYTRVEVECHRALEDLQAANLRVEQLRTETANLRAEKKIWEVCRSLLSQFFIALIFNLISPLVCPSPPRGRESKSFH